ncbi:DUF308 domain-containing protein [Aquibium sp. A9E412]|uniref:HdeD family acid-resistance protein n=1 Tax=Aquibium sp. A9E412 TaxID=2976767 RepID=UPI0025B05A0B|nr:DUF308 domain-containing protein [Aquibium sp. A9E412]MDN2564673.1 DUF308 domain-containing protein [Aquibium sp. A9E412]
MTDTSEPSRQHSAWIWLAIVGAVSLIGGVLALANPFAATLAAEMLAAWTFLIFGVLQLLQATRMRDWRGFTWSLLLGLVTVVVGVSLLLDPAAGVISLTVLVAVLFLVLGAVKVLYALAYRPLPGWLLPLLSGLLSVVLGLMILANFPWSAAAVLGVLLAVELISNGVFCLVVAFGLRGR